MRPYPWHSEPVAQKQMMRSRYALGEIMQTRRVLATIIAQVGGTPRLVECRPPVDAVTEPARYDFRKVSEGICRCAIGPATFIFKVYWQVPVIERRHRHNIVL